MVSAPIGVRWRSSDIFILVVVGVGQLSETLIYVMILPVLPFLLRERFNVPKDQIQNETSNILTTFTLSTLVFSIPAGILVDARKTRRVPFLSSLFLLTISIVVFTQAKTLPLLIFSRFLGGLSGAILHAAGLAMVVDTVGSEKLGIALGSIQSISSIGELGAPPIGGFVYAKFGINGILVVGMIALSGDFILRLLVIERKSVYTAPRSVISDTGDVSSSLEQQALLHPSESAEGATSGVQVHKTPHHFDIVKAFPILRCCKDVRLLVALYLIFVQLLIIGTFDATLTSELSFEFGYTSLEAGATFLFLGIPNLISAPVAGFLTDKVGARIVATVSFALFTPMLILFRLPSSPVLGSQSQNVRAIIFCLVLATNGIFLSAVGTASLVEAESVVSTFEKNQPGVFGPNGAYGQLFGLTGLVFQLGISIGIVGGGYLTTKVGYGNMYAIAAIFTAVGSVLAFMFMEKRKEKTSSDITDNQ